MTATLVGKTTGGNNGATSSSLASDVTLPAGCLADDELIVFAGENTGSNTIDTSAAPGWTISSPQTPGSGVLRGYTLNRKLTLADISTADGGTGTGVIPVRWTGTGARPIAAGEVWRGLDATTPVETIGATSGVASSATAPSASTTVNNSPGVIGVITRVTTGSAADPAFPAGWTDDGTAATAFSSGVQMAADIGHVTTPGTAGNIGGGTVTTSPSAVDIIVFVVPLRAAVTVTPVSVTPPAGPAVAAATTPGLSAGRHLAAVAAVALAAVTSPAVSSGVHITPPAAAATAAATAPALSRGQSLAAPAGAATAAGTSPAVHAGADVTPPSGAATGAPTAPAVSGSVQIAPPAAAASASATSPGLHAGRSVAVPAGAATAATTAPSLAAGLDVTPPAGAATAAASPPAVTAGSSTSANVSPPAATATAAATGPTVSVGTVLTPPTPAATASPTAPGVSAGATVAVPAAPAVADVTPPGVTAGASVPVDITPPAADATASATPPAVRTVNLRDITISPGPVLTLWHGEATADRWDPGPEFALWHAGPTLEDA